MYLSMVWNFYDRQNIFWNDSCKRKWKKIGFEAYKRSARGLKIVAEFHLPYILSAVVDMFLLQQAHLYRAHWKVVKTVIQITSVCTWNGMSITLRRQHRNNEHQRYLNQ